MGVLIIRKTLLAGEGILQPNLGGQQIKNGGGDMRSQS
jgi:hypothetical protein